MSDVVAPSSHVEALTLDHRPGSVDQNAEDPGKFPFQAFEFDQPSSAIPGIRVLPPWKFSGDISNFYPKVVTSADYVVLDSDRYTDIFVSTGAADRTITLPTLADNQGRFLRIYKTDSGVGEVVVDGEGSETIAPWTTVRTGYQYQMITVVGTASCWFVVSGANQPVASEPSLGTLHLFATEPNTWNALSNGQSSTWVDIDVSSFVPINAKAVLLTCELNFTASPAAASSTYIQLRKNGSTASPIAIAAYAITPSINGTIYFHRSTGLVVRLDGSRIFEYQAGWANVSTHGAYLMVIGYYV